MSFSSPFPGDTILHKAVRDGNPVIVKAVLFKGDVNAKNENSNTSLHIAAIHNNVECMRCLLEHPDIDIEAKNCRGETAIFAAADCGSAGCMRELIGKADVFAKDNRGRTMLHIAAASSLRCVKIALEADIDKNIRDNDDKLAVDYTANEDILALIDDHQELPIVKPFSNFNI